MSDVKMNTKMLDQLAKAFKSNNMLIKVGIFGGSHPAPEGSKTHLSNAEVGAFHELDEGRTVMPRRSFLQIPLSTKFSPYLATSKLMRNGAVVKEMIDSGNLNPLYDTMQVVAMRVVDDAFDTSGFGTWPASDMKNKKNHQTLIESGALEESIATLEVPGGG